ncbi:MAG: cupin domain-containing protein [Bacteroidales bacterium]|nr:cupin domain-containing protein [Bacteroidales bacterium]
MKQAVYWIDKLELLPHPEGGYFKEVYRSSENINQKALPNRFDGCRAFSTSIYFLLENQDFSAFHRIKSDELWHFYAGGPLEIFVIHPDGKAEIMTLGNNPDQGESLQLVVSAGSWFASKPKSNTVFALVGCTVAPGFDFMDFEMAKKEDLLLQYPAHQQWIEQLCRE